MDRLYNAAWWWLPGPRNQKNDPRILYEWRVENLHFFIFSYRQAAIDFSKEADIPLDKEACLLMEEKNAIRELLLSENIEEAIQKINKIDEKVKNKFQFTLFL